MVTDVRKNYPGLMVERLPSGNARIRVRVEGDKARKITMTVPLDHPKFSEHYWAAREGNILIAEPVSTAVPRTLRWLTDGYLAHLAAMVTAGQASSATQRQRRSMLTRMCDHLHTDKQPYGSKTLDAPPAIFVALRDARAATPAEADNMMKAIRMMYVWAITTGMTKINPAVGIASIHRSKGGATPWTAADLRQFRDKHPAGTMAHLALTLHMFTACRSGDAIWLGRGNEVLIGGARHLQWQPRKRGASQVTLPIAAPLAAAIRATATIGAAYILSSNGQPFGSVDSYRNRFRDWCDAAGLTGRSSHGVRKAMAELLAESGASENQIMSVLSHTQPLTSAIYTKGAKRRILASQAMAGLGTIDW